MSQKLRQRKKKKEKRSSPDTKRSEDEGSTLVVKKQQQKEIQKTLLRYLVGAVLLYCLRRASRRVILKHPHWVNAVIPNLLRPSVDFEDERQVLIVGTMSSGTSQVAADLKEKLGLEIGHEATDALDNYIRDGTSSWFHGIRFFDDSKQKQTIINDLCYNFTEKMGFHPRQYHEVPGCSEKKPWYPLSECWLEDCLDILHKEWGCAATDGCNDTQPFRRTLHQIRDPRSTVESLVAKFCKNEDSSQQEQQQEQLLRNGTMQADWVKFHNILFQGRGHDFEKYNCIEAASAYVMEYNTILLQARERGWIDGMYKVETTPPCRIAKMAGFLHPASVVYKPNYRKVQSKCSFPSSAARRPMSSTINQINKGRIRLSWSDYQGGKHGSTRPEGDTSLEDAMRKFIMSLGYDPDAER